MHDNPIVTKATGLFTNREVDNSNSNFRLGFEFESKRLAKKRIDYWSGVKPKEL